jgi:hypothetical protein
LVERPGVAEQFGFVEEGVVDLHIAPHATLLLNKRWGE